MKNVVLVMHKARILESTSRTNIYFYLRYITNRAGEKVERYFI